MTADAYSLPDPSVGNADAYALLPLGWPHIAELQRLVGYHLAGAPSNARLLDIGTGHGATARVIAEHHPTAHVVTVELDPVSAAAASVQLGDLIASGRVEVVTADAVDYLKSAPSRSFDGIGSCHTLHNLLKPHREALLAHAHRVLRPGAVFVNSDKYARDDDEEQQDVFGRQMARLVMYDRVGRLDLATAWFEHYVIDERADRIQREGVSVVQLQQIGFQDVAIVFRKMMDAAVCARIG